MQQTAVVVFSLLALLNGNLASGQTMQIGIFEGHRDVGECGQIGAVQYDRDTNSYTVAGGGENMWFDTDAFHYVYKQVSGDVSLAADVEWLGSGGNPHRKACLIVRQSLDADAAYADAAAHGNGLASLQYRETAGDITHEIQSAVSAPRRLRIEKVGDYVSMSIAGLGEALHSAGGTFRIELTDPFYLGLGVCAHDNRVLEKAVFSDVEVDTGSQLAGGSPVLESTLETIAVASGDRRVVYHMRGHLEAPNWSRDGGQLIFNSEGKIYGLPISGGEPQHTDTGFATRCNNDHGLSPDGRQLAISDQTNGPSRIYILPSSGGEPRLVMPAGPSYWHGWSPDGQSLAYCAERKGNYDIYTISVDGGVETRLTSAAGLDDGPDYSSDGQYIYFNSDRTGTMQIWRMRNDGSDQEQFTFDQYNDWFPHPSPDGQWIVFLSYAPDVEGHPENKDVMLRLISTAGGEIRVLAKLFGGQGTINVPSWSPDSSRFAFASYRLVGG